MTDYWNNLGDNHQRKHDGIITTMDQMQDVGVNTLSTLQWMNAEAVRIIGIDGKHSNYSLEMKSNKPEPTLMLKGIIHGYISHKTKWKKLHNIQ